MRKLLAAVTVVLVSACAGGQSRDDSPFDPSPQSSGRITIVADNLQFNEATLYVLSDGGSRQRIGTVGGKNRATMRADWEGNRELRIEIRLLAGERYTTPGINVSPGERLELMIENPVQRSVVRRTGGGR